jgi:hypothetical protein
MGNYKQEFMPSFVTIYDQDEIRGEQWTAGGYPEIQDQPRAWPLARG